MNKQIHNNPFKMLDTLRDRMKSSMLLNEKKSIASKWNNKSNNNVYYKVSAARLRN